MYFSETESFARSSHLPGAKSPLQTTVGGKSWVGMKPFSLDEKGITEVCAVFPLVNPNTLHSRVLHPGELRGDSI
jgi:hypothetical protein